MKETDYPKRYMMNCATEANTRVYSDFCQTSPAGMPAMGDTIGGKYSGSPWKQQCHVTEVVVINKEQGIHSIKVTEQSHSHGLDQN